MVATDASLSVMVTVAIPSSMVTRPPVTLLIIPLKVSAGSARLSSIIGTVKVKLAPAADPAGKVNFPLVAT
ncbi:hypothetical protein D3C87_716170 [compost metagenome]